MHDYKRKPDVGLSHALKQEYHEKGSSHRPLNHYRDRVLQHQDGRGHRTKTPKEEHCSTESTTELSALNPYCDIEVVTPAATSFIVIVNPSKLFRP